MLVPLSWLKEYVDVTQTPSELAEELTLRGMEVKGIEVVGADWTDVVVGRLLSVERHPNADKLWLTSVDVGADTPLQVVCGADNIAAGQLVPVALVGAVLAGERRIERTKIRGVESRGMLCSAIELGIGADAEGIHILGTGNEFPVGADLRELIGEVVLDVDVKPNRGDALSMIGLAREVAAITGGAARWPASAPLSATSNSAGSRISVFIEDSAACPRFTALLFDQVQNRPSPPWMQRRLLAAGMRPISAIVDVTNYVMHELGQPMHAYDADGVARGRIGVRRALDGERLTTIDHVERSLDSRMLVIAGDGGPLGLAGIMGGADTEVTAGTTRVILESAIFHGPTVRNTARRLGLRSEASMRHEKGLPHDLPARAAERAASLIIELTGARISAEMADSNPQPQAARQVTVDLDRVRRLLGLAVDAAATTKLLTPLGFHVAAADGETVTVTVPWYRTDVVLAEDVAEEIARSHGFGNLAGRLPVASLPPFREDPSGARHRVRRVLAGLGLDEVLSHALVGAADLARSGLDPAGPELVRIANPLSEEHAVLRPSLHISLLAALAGNVRQRLADPWIFEVGKTYQMGPVAGEIGAETAGTGRFESWQLGIALLGPRTPRSVDGETAPADLAELKGLIEALYAALNAPFPSFRAPSSEDRGRYLHPGRQAEIVDRGRRCGLVGELSPAIVDAWDLPGRPVIATIRLHDLLAAADPDAAVAVPPPAQPIDRDLAIVVSESVPVGELLRLVRENAGPLLVRARLFDQYRGPQIGDGNVSYAVALHFQPLLPGDERSIERALQRIRGALSHNLSAAFR